MGVRGIALGEGDSVISLSILRHVDATADERDGLSQDAPARCGAADERRERADGR